MSSSLALVLDWDGTVTEVDSLHMVIERFGDREAYVALESGSGAASTSSSPPTTR